MPFALVFIGLIMIVTGAKGTQSALGKQLVSDFTGPGNFFYWFASIGVIGAAGSIPGFKPFSRMFMTLIIVAMVLRNGGVFDKFMQALATGPIAPDSSAESSNASAKNMVAQGAADLQSSAGNSLQSVVSFRESTTRPPADPWANFQTAVSVATKLFGF
jgi:hypothetical protein